MPGWVGLWPHHEQRVAARWDKDKKKIGGAMLGGAHMMDGFVSSGLEMGAV